MSAASKPWWQQATAVVSLGASGAITGFSFTPGTAHAAQPTPAQIRLLALQQVAKPAHNSDAALRSAIVNVARYYLRMAEDRTPAEMEALIWRHDSVDGADHGPSCAAFASLTLELGSQAIGQQSWVTGGTSYPWPLHDWADVRVDPNPASPGVMSVLQDAQAHGRWHPIGDGYKPQPGDWVLFNGHVEVVTAYAGGVLHTIGGDSLPNLSVNAHEYANPLSAQGVAGFVNNGRQAGASARHSGGGHRTRANQANGQRSGGGKSRSVTAGTEDTVAAVGAAAVPGTSTPSAPPAATAGAGDGSGRATGSAVRADGSGTRAGSAGSASGSTTQGNAGSSSGSAGQATEPARGQWHSTHPRTSHRPARTVHTHSPGTTLAGAGSGRSGSAVASGDHHDGGPATATVPGALPGAVSLGPPTKFQKAANGGAAIPGLPTAAHHAHNHRAATPSPGTGARTGHSSPAQSQPAQSQSGQARSGQAQSAQPQSGQTQMTSAQRAFIAEVAPGAVAAAHKYGVPASVTIAQAIDESGWGQSVLASKDHNLFGMKGAGPAGTDTQLTQEYENGQWLVTAAPFRAYHSVSQSIDDHGRLLATSGYYRGVMGSRHSPDAFASALTGVYATDPSYGQTLIGLMRQYNLYQYDHAAPPTATQHHAARPARSKPSSGQSTTGSAAPGQASIPGVSQPGPGSSTRGRGSGSASGRGSRPGVSSPPRTGRPAPSSPPPTSGPTPSSPPVSTPPSPTPPPSSSPTPSSPPSAAPTPSSPPNSATVSSSPPRAARTAPTTPARGGRPVTARSVQGARTATGSRPSNAPPSNNPGSPGNRSAQGTSQLGSSSIPGVSQPVRNARQRPGQPGTGAARPTQPRNGSAGSTAPTRAPAGTAPSGVGSPGASQPTQSTRPAAPTGSAPSGNTAQTSSAKPVKAALVADWIPTPAGAGGSTATASAPAAGGARSATTGATSSATDEPAHSETAGEWDPASWVPDWANEAHNPAVTGTGSTEPAVTEPDITATDATSARKSRTRRVRGLTGLRDRLTVVQSPRSAASAGSSARPGRYDRQLPRVVRNAFQATAKGPLLRAEPLYRDVAAHTGLPWELLAACDWMQCEAKPKYSPVHGEKLGTSNDDGTEYWTKSAALEQCAEDMVELARTVYGIDLTASGPLSVRDLANTFAAFRWGELLKVHRTSAMEFPYSVAGLTVQHIGMRWPTINDSNAPDKPGSRFRMHFGAVPVLLSLDYPAMA